MINRTPGPWDVDEEMGGTWGPDAAHNGGTGTPLTVSGGFSHPTEDDL